MNPLKSLQDHGQAVWLDFLSRGFLAKGGLKKLVDADGMRGVTSNPSIFEQAIGQTDEYDTAIARLLQALRLALRDCRHVATCLEFGPRFLHSTGQAYKGGPDSGVFLQITCDDAGDLAIPGHRASFGVVKAAQARGDFDVLAYRGRRALRVHLDADVDSGLATLAAAIERALA
jgi:hypothetical protein